MRLAYKQLLKQILRNKIFVLLLLLLTILTAFSFFFVAFSIDGNMAILKALPELTENQLLFKIGLNSNTILMYNFIIWLTALTALVFVMFYYRFYRSNKKQIGCLKALGFRDKDIRSFFVVFTAVLSMLGAALGLLGGYHFSDVLINANMRTYMVTGLVKESSPLNLIAGLLGPAAVYCITAYFCYSFVRGKEPGALIMGNSNHAHYSAVLGAAHKTSSLIPIKNKFPLRIALRKPLAILLLIAAVMSFSVCMIIGRSLNISSQRVFESQTVGHHYEYDIKFPEYQTGPLPDGAIAYLNSSARMTLGRYDIEQTMIGLYSLNDVYQLQNNKGVMLSIPQAGTAYINPGLHETYGVKIGDMIIAELDGAQYAFTVADIAANAKSAGIYVNANELAGVMSIPAGAYNGALSMVEINGGSSIAKIQRIDDLNRNAVSNQVSGVINQVIGCVIGAILIFLALYMSFQDNTRDMLILHMIGYRRNNIRKLLIDVYRPIVWAAFIITLAPSILLVQSIQRSLSISTKDYMPFETNIVVVLITFIILNIICLLVQAIFGFGVRRTIAKEEIADMVYVE